MEDIEAMLCAYVEGDLDAAGRAQIEQHLANHPQHRKLIEELIAQRQLLRDLPRAAAPRDVDESVRGQMERSILLDDAAGQPFSAASRRRRMPQLMTAAAVILLSAALGLTVYRVVVPTFKPAKFTPVASSQQLSNTQSEIETDIKQSQEQDVTSQAQAGQPTQFAAASPAPQLQQAQQFTVAEAPLAAAAPAAMAGRTQKLEDLPIDLDRLKKTLKDNGYDLTPKTDQQNPSIVMVVNSPDPAATGDLVAKYLASQKTISWNGIPSQDSAGAAEGDRQGLSSATTVPSYIEAESLQTRVITSPIFTAPTTRPSTLPSTHPSTDWVLDSTASTQPSESAQNVYVVHGLTEQQAEDLGKSISNLQSGITLQTSDDSSLEPATQPSVQRQLLATATTQVDKSANQLATAVTQPSAPGPFEYHGGTQTTGSPITLGGSGGSSQLVDAIIVVQSTPAPAAVAPASTEPADGLPTTAPSTQPDTMTAPSTEPSSY
jgi:hypothetical protein